MTLTEQITADEQAVKDAQAALDAAQATLAKDKAAYDALQPHISLLDQIQGEVGKLETEAANAISPLIAQLRSLFNV